MKMLEKFNENFEIIKYIYIFDILLCALTFLLVHDMQ